MLLTLIFSACSDSQTSEPNRDSSPFEITSPREPITHDRSLPLVMTWNLLDQAVAEVHIYYRPDDVDGWILDTTVTASQCRVALRLDGFDQKKYLFAMSTLDGRYWDSSAAVTLHWFPVILIEPKAEDFRLISDEQRFMWMCSDDRIENVEIRWAATGSRNWSPAWSIAAADSLSVMNSVPWGSGVKLDFAIRGIFASGTGLPPTEWSVVQEVGFGELSIISPAPGNEFYRFLKTNISVSIVLPPGFPADVDSVFELSTNSGGTWMEISPKWTILQPATDQAYVRLHHAGMNRTVMSGPFRITDRSSTYFSLSPGQEFRYYHYRISGGFGGPIDTTSREWITINIQNALPGSSRTEYPCSVRVVKEDGSTSTSIALLWQEHDGQKLISGNFLPFTDCRISGIHDNSIDTYTETISASTPGQIPWYHTAFDAQRGKGLTRREYTYMAARQPPVQFNDRYILLD
ncbi:MAG: hypothetical protein WC824_02375 [Bacteroidota bacterium]